MPYQLNIIALPFVSPAFKWWPSIAPLLWTFSSWRQCDYKRTLPLRGDGCWYRYYQRQELLLSIPDCRYKLAALSFGLQLPEHCYHRVSVQREFSGLWLPTKIKVRMQFWGWWRWLFFLLGEVALVGKWAQWIPIPQRQHIWGKKKAFCLQTWPVFGLTIWHEGALLGQRNVLKRLWLISCSGVAVCFTVVISLSLGSFGGAGGLGVQVSLLPLLWSQKATVPLIKLVKKVAIFNWMEVSRNVAVKLKWSDCLLKRGELQDATSLVTGCHFCHRGK